MTNEDLEEIQQLITTEAFDQALKKTESILANNPNNATATFVRGLIYERTDKLEAAENDFITAITLGAETFSPFFHLASLQSRQYQVTQAAITLHQGIELLGQQNIPEEWFDKLSEFFVRLGQHHSAVFWSQKRLEIEPENLDALNRLGLSFAILQRPQDALQVFQKALSIKQDDARIHFNLSGVLRQLREFKAAVNHSEMAARLDPKYSDPGSLSMVAGSLLDFDRQERYADEGFKQIDAGETIPQPFGYFFITDCPSTIKKANQLHSQMYELGVEQKLARPSFHREKIRIGYLSADFKTHATSFLIEEMIRRHDRSQFEVLGFDFSHRAGQSAHEGIHNAFDEFVEVMADSHEDTAQRIAAYDIDILVDLKGYTENCRPQILSYRPGRVQVNFLGYPGTMGNPHIDYFIGDTITTPSHLHEFFQEHIVELPCCYQPNNPNRKVGAATDRSAHGLPTDAFVFSCFNHHWKYTREQVVVWKNILDQCPESVLWVMENVGKTDIGQVLADMGIPRSRLVVSPLTEPEKHLERIRHANVFLDTYPCGAHTTASDSILGGVPVLNRMGDAFHTRVSASIMAHASAPEFICTSTEEYIEKAITCYQTPEILNDVKTKILDQTQVHHPYNIDTTTRAIEIGFKKMIEKADNLGSIKIDPW